MRNGSGSIARPKHLYGLLVLMVLLWSLNFAVARWLLREMPALLAAGLRTLLAGGLLAPAYWWRGRKQEAAPWVRSDILTMLLLGLLGVCLNQVLFLVGLSRTTTAHAAILVGLTPLVVLLLSANAGLERLSLRRLCGMATALLGVGLLQVTSVKAGKDVLTGDLFIVAASFCFALFTVLGKTLSTRHGPLTVNTFAYASGSLALLPAIAWQASGFDFAKVSLVAWLCLLYMALFPSVVCYLIFYYALARIPASRVSNFGYLQPLFATAFGVLLLGESITPALVAGGVLVLAGVFVAERG